MHFFAASLSRNKRRVRERACFQVVTFVLCAVSCSLGQVTYSAGWTERLGTGPWGNKAHTTTTVNATATIQDTGTEAFVIHRTGPECGILKVVVDGDPSTIQEIDAYSPEELWNRKTVIVSDIAKGPHTIVVTVTGKKNTKASGASIQIVDNWTLGRGMWSPEKAWAWYKSKPWIVGWDYTPSTCVNAIEWWQDETHVSDSAIHRELGLGEQLGHNSIIVYLPYIVWVKDSAYLKNRFSRFLTIAASHHFTVTPIFFDDVGFKTGEPSLGDQGEPNPGLLMSQWTMDPGPTLSVATGERPSLKRFVQDFIRTYGQDSRILMWNIYNEPGNTNMGTKTFPLVELAFQWVREIGPSQPLTVSEWGNYVNPWPYDLSDVCSFHGYTNNAGLLSDITKLRRTQRPIICTEWLARGSPGTDIAKDLPLFKRLGVGCFSWSLINGRMHCERSWPSFGSYNDPWFHDILYNNGKPYRAAEVDALFNNLAHKTINWMPGTTDGSMVAKNGCTDPRYAQYDSLATVDNGSCTTLLPPLVIRGCTDPNSKNYNPLATQNDPAMCNAVTISVPSPAGKGETFRRESFGFIGRNRINLSGSGTMLVQLFSCSGRLLWSESRTVPRVIDIGTDLHTGVYFARVFRNGVNTGIRPMIVRP